MSKVSKTTGTVLAVALVAASGVAPAQGYYGNDGAPYRQAYSDQARVLRVDPVFVGGACRADPYYGNGNAYYDDDYGAGRAYADGYDGSGYGDGDGDGGSGYGYGDERGYAGNGGTQGGRTAATIVGTIVGAALGSQVGGGSARYATAAIGSAVGGIAGRQIYDNSHQSYRTGTVRVGDVQSCRPGARERVDGYDVTYEYAGRQYVTRTRYNPGSYLRVRVDVRPEQ
jgi:hypothetical protein